MQRRIPYGMRMSNRQTIGPEIECSRCHRPLRTQASRAARIGSRCAAIEAAFDGLNAKQCEKARKLAASGAVTKIRDGVYAVPSGSGKSPYITFVSGDCRCDWGYHRKPGDKVCYHVGTARLLARPRLALAA